MPFLQRQENFFSLQEYLSLIRPKTLAPVTFTGHMMLFNKLIDMPYKNNKNRVI
jgi:hypothetical protein